VATEVRPVIKPVLVVNLLRYAASLGALGVLLAALRLPSYVYYPLLLVAALLAGIYLLLATSLAYWRHLTETYAIDGDQILIRRGLFNRSGTAIASRNISDIQTVLPLFLRPFHVGLVKVSTNDGAVHPFYNIKRPADFAENLRSLLRVRSA